MTRIPLDDENVVVIIGSGAGGGTLANELCQKGIRCVVLEAGPRYDFNDFVNDEFTMDERLTWNDPRSMTGSALAARSHNSPTWICKTVGGTTVRWSGVCPRFQAHEFQAATKYGQIMDTNLIDWPLNLSELAPFYLRAEDKLGVTGTHGIPHLPANNNFTVLAEGAKRIGYEKISTGHMAINPLPRDGRPGCMQIGFCMQGCKIGAKWSTLYTEIPSAESTGLLDLRSESMAVQILHDKSGKANGVLYADSTGQYNLQKARVVCVAGNAIETPRLLLNSSSSLFPDGLANSSGQVGKNYMKHTTGAVFALFDNPINMHRGTSMAGSVDDEIRHEPSRGFAGGYRFEVCSFGMPTLALAWPDLWGSELSEVMEGYTQLAGLWICGEDLPMETNRITLDPKIKDSFGLPVARVNIDDHPNDVAMLRHAYGQATSLYESIGARKVLTIPPYPAGHNMGSARMSRKSSDGVVNSWGQSHDIPNLFVSDGSSFTSSGAANPTLTIVALAIRQAEFITSQMKQLEV